MVKRQDTSGFWEKKASVVGCWVFCVECGGSIRSEVGQICEEALC